MSGRIWEKQGRRVYFLQRWPSRRSMKRVRQRVKELTGKNRSGVRDARVIIDEDDFVYNVEWNLTICLLERLSCVVCRHYYDDLLVVEHSYSSENQHFT